MVCITGRLRSQPRTATLEGKITDKSDGSPLIGAAVHLKGTTIGTAADLNGHFRITGIPPRTYNIEITFIGYKPVLLTGIRLKAGQTKTISVAMQPTALTIEEEVVVVGEKPLVDVEAARSSQRLGMEKLEAAPVRPIQGLLNTQVGVMTSPAGLHIRGGRTYETGFFIDGVSAKDPLAGTGFGVDVASDMLGEIEVTTGAADVEFGNATAGVVQARTRSGGERFSGKVRWKRDNFGFNRDWRSTFNQDILSLTLSGPFPGIPAKKLRYYLSGQFNYSDLYLKNPAHRLYSSLMDNDPFWSPRQDNRWSLFTKWTYLLTPTQEISASYLNTLTVNQDLNMLRITSNEVGYRPGYQFRFHLMPDNANTFTHHSTLTTLQWKHTPSPRWTYKVILSRLYVRLRGDANGRPWRPDTIRQELDPYVIASFPVDYFNPDDSVVFIMPVPALYNNGGIATLWHDHVVEEYAIKPIFHFYSNNGQNRLTIGWEHKEQFFQWIDIRRPWVGAPIRLPDGSVSRSYRLGEISDIWRVRPANGALFAAYRFRRFGFILNGGLRLEYWMPGRFVDQAVRDSAAPIADAFRQAYLSETVPLLGRRARFFLLPRLGVSFPVNENQVLFFNYSHATILPHPTYVYTGLDPYYADRSTLRFVGNPALGPEVDISYELGLKSQLGPNDALTMSAYWKDKYQFITASRVQIKDVTGRDITRTIRINSDYARVRGVELTYHKRLGKWLKGQASVAYSSVTGQSASANETIRQILSTGNREDTREYPLPWDRPLDLKANVLIRPPKSASIPWLKDYSFYVEATYRSGLRYTPYLLTGAEPVSGRPIYERSSLPQDYYGRIGKNWFWVDMTMRKWWKLKKVSVALSVEITNVFDNRNPAIINPVTGRAYEYGDPVPSEWLDYRYMDPRDPRSWGLPPDNPARYMPQRHILAGISIRW